MGVFEIRADGTAVEWRISLPAALILNRWSCRKSQKLCRRREPPKPSGRRIWAETECSSPPAEEKSFAGVKNIVSM
jgi:hypothetical protein